MHRPIPAFAAPRRVLCFLLLAFAAGLAGVPGSAGPEGGKSARRYLPDAVLVAFHEDAPRAERVGTLGRLGLEVDRAVRSPYFTRLRLGAQARAAGASLSSTLAALRRDPAVRIAQPDYLNRLDGIPTDPSFPEQWALHNTGQRGGTPDADIDAPEAWEITTGGDVVVAVVDSGVDYTHPDLAANILRDGNGQLVGYDFGNGDADPMDRDGHGTHVAGSIGARGNNGVGISGVAQRVKIMPLKMFSDGGDGPNSSAIQCIDYAIAHGARILNFSWGGAPYDELLLEAIQRANAAGILVCVAAGNDALCNDTIVHYPASYNPSTENILSIGATDRNDTLSAFSNFGGLTVDLAAPGETIYSTVLNHNYASFSGTSMATPHVAGAAALLLSRYPALTLFQLKARLLGTADRPRTLQGRVVAGRLNVHAALVDDRAAPDAPSELTATHRSSGALRLSWEAGSDAGGGVFRYELRYDTAPIDPAFTGGTRVVLPPVHSHAGAPAGAAETWVLGGLSADTDYYVALRTVDRVGNVSPAVVAGPFRTAPAGAALLEDDAEGELRFQGEGSWAVTTEHSSGHVYADSPGSLYADGLDSSLTQRQAVRLGQTDPVLGFRARTRIQENVDFLYVEASGDAGVTWTKLQTMTGHADWSPHLVPLRLFQGRDVLVRFRLVTDAEISDDGVWIDDIRIADRSASASLLQDDVEGRPAFVVPHPWSRAQEHWFSATHAYTDSAGRSYGMLLDTSITQSAPISLAGTDAALHFWARTDLESELETGFDFLNVEASADGKSWHCLLSLTGTRSGSFYSAPLTRFSGGPVWVRFRLKTDRTIALNGVWIDDIRISGEALRPLQPAGGRIDVAGSVAFGGVARRKSRVRPVVIRNTSTTESLTFTLNAPAAPFSLSRPVGTVTLPPGGTHTARIAFRPTQRGPAQGSLLIGSTDSQTPLAVVTLTGSGR